MDDPNQKFLIADSNDARVVPETRTRVYILNPGDWFQGFGGSRHGLKVRKTASLIVRSEGIGGLIDTEHEVNDQQIWSRLLQMVRAGNLSTAGKQG